MFSLTNEMKVYKPQIPQYAVRHFMEGPAFGSALEIYYGGVRSFTEGDCEDKAKYNIPNDSNGNSVLTGSKGYVGIKEWEVYLVE